MEYADAIYDPWIEYIRGEDVLRSFTCAAHKGEVYAMAQTSYTVHGLNIFGVTTFSEVTETGTVFKDKN
jgi:hypothetical protein